MSRRRRRRAQLASPSEVVRDPWASVPGGGEEGHPLVVEASAFRIVVEEGDPDECSGLERGPEGHGWVAMLHLAHGHLGDADPGGEFGKGPAPLAAAEPDLCPKQASRFSSSR